MTEKPKTRWCDVCKRRHDSNHEHFKGVRDRAADTVTGAKSAAELAAQAERGKPQDISRRFALERLKAEQDREQREALERRWGRRMRLIYGVWARIADDPKLRLSDEEEKDFGQVHADFAIAWGIAASTKLEATFDVLTIHTTVIAARSKWVAEMLEKVKGKETDENEQTGGRSDEASHAIRD